MFCNHVIVYLFHYTVNNLRCTISSLYGEIPLQQEQLWAHSRLSIKATETQLITGEEKKCDLKEQVDYWSSYIWDLTFKCIVYLVSK